MSIDTLFSWFHDKYAWQEWIPVDLQPGHDKLLVITGENASGKSLIRRLLQAVAKKQSCEAIAVSPEFRQHGGLRNAFVYGDETYQASGEIACHVVIGSMRTSQQRAEPHLVILDEPDMGMSDNTAAGAALAIAQFCYDPPPHLGLYAVVTHRKAMLEQFLPYRPSHIRVGDKLTLEQVVSLPVSPVAPGEVLGKSRELFRQMSTVLRK